MGQFSNVLHKVTAKCLQPINRLLDRVERRWVPDHTAPLKHPLIFIIGSPRSGTTLLYQAVVASVKCGYFTNLHATFHGGPALLQRVLSRLMPLPAPAASEFRSNEGRTNGWLGPAESGQFWYRWFPRQPQYVGANGVNAEQLASLRNVIADLSASFNAPIVIKNLTCGLRLQPLAQAFPEALFIVLRRSPVWTAQSLLLARRRVKRNDAAWWSVEPPSVEQLRQLPPMDQVARQVTDIYRTIERDAASVGEDRFFWIDYEPFCDDPRGHIAQVLSWLRGRGWAVQERGELPAHFARSDHDRLGAGEFESLSNAVERASAMRAW